MSPRPKKLRKCHGRFCGKAFKPSGVPVTDLDQVEMYRDEMEVLRLCDMEGLTQEEAGQSMGVSRGTIQRIITVARRKVATALTRGNAIIYVDEVKQNQSV
jgi:predicted DNA-binding protein (UPF0251 family)